MNVDTLLASHYQIDTGELQLPLVEELLFEAEAAPQFFAVRTIPEMLSRLDSTGPEPLAMAYALSNYEGRELWTAIAEALTAHGWAPYRFRCDPHRTRWVSPDWNTEEGLAEVAEKLQAILAPEESERNDDG